MSGSETGLIASRDAFGLGLEKSSVPPSQPMIQNMGLGFMAPTSPSYNHQSAAAADGSTGVGTSVNMNMSMEPMSKKKRGRPRKYSPNGKMTGALTHAPPSAGGVFSPPPPLPPRPHVGAVVAAPCPSGAASPSSSSLKKARGRPRGSSKKHQMEVLEPVGLGFTPHVISVKAGEDVQAKIMSFSQHGPRAVCMLTANGTISNVTLRQPASSGGTVTYEGRFEILSLSGSFLLSENGSQRSRTGGLSVSLAGPDGCVIGGGVAGLLTAAAPVQVVVGSFISDGRKEFKPANQAEPLSVTPKLPMGTGATGESSPPSHGTPIGSSDGGSPLNHSMGAYNDRNPQGISAMPWK